ncbi:acyltransferase family protein [Alienimonas californiensis]|uniref:O-acetyltransferase OatA n=1 Tax=Alienimonas californiensis TaxID=2527989 RepID=A0A517P6H5_9PLAN|nr:acyltransferase [Alienimonas californiensis]QDT14980.1 O-acetyltransferase OatA [Alienimonas californiensis]
MSAAVACRSPPGGYLRGLDGLRGAAVGMVLFAHSVIYDEFSSWRSVGSAAGGAGVTIFFVLSGYLITRLLLAEERRTGTIALKLFYARRAVRLFPALWLYLAVVGLLALPGFLPDCPWHSFAASLLYLRNLVGRGHETAHLWSLSIEEQFYLLWPFVIVLLPGRDRVRLGAALAGVVTVTVWRTAAAAEGWASPAALYLRTDFRFDAPLVGCALALLEQVRPSLFDFWTTPGRSDLLAGTAAAALVSWITLGGGGPIAESIRLTGVCLSASALIVSQLGTPGPLSGWFAWTPLVALGRISYGVYLWQQLFLGPHVDGFERLRSFPNGLAATFAAALLSYWLLERPLLAFKNRRLRVVHGPPPERSPSDRSPLR